jgi:septation ring formation regulator EzrA
VEQSRQRTDDWLQTTRNQLESVEQQLQAMAQQLQEFQQQLMDADVRIKNEVAEIQRREVTEIQSIVEERRRKVETLIGELAQEMEQFTFPSLPETTSGLKLFMPCSDRTGGCIGFRSLYPS